MAKRAAFMALALAAASFGPASAGDDPACKKYEDPLAYNACLASHGPKANVENRPRADQELPASSAQPERGKPASIRSARGWPHPVQGHGRVHMEFRVN